MVVRLSEFDLLDHEFRLPFLPSQEIPVCTQNSVPDGCIFLIISKTYEIFHLKEIEFRSFSEKRSTVCISFVNYMKRSEREREREIERERERQRERLYGCVRVRILFWETFQHRVWSSCLKITFLRFIPRDSSNIFLKSFFETFQPVCIGFDIYLKERDQKVLL